MRIASHLKTNIKSAINYRIGKVMRSCGIVCVPERQYPRCNINALELACLLLRNKLFGDVKIIQIGAFDGIHNDPLRRILCSQNGVTAILVEPQRGPFSSLQELYRDRPKIYLENVAIAEADGETDIWVTKDDSASTPKASLSIHHARKFGLTRSYSVRTVTVEKLLATYGWSCVDLLQIDAEGHDLQILKQFMQLDIKPRVVNSERWHLSCEDEACLTKLLTSNGYRYIDWGKDRLAVLQREFDRLHF